MFYNFFFLTVVLSFALLSTFSVTFRYSLPRPCNYILRKIYYSSVAIQMKATQQYFSVVLFIVVYKVILTFKSP